MDDLIIINLFIFNFDMKRFFAIVFIYVLVVFLLLLPGELYKMYFMEDFESIAGYEIRVAEKNSKTKTSKKVKKLILGDSTGHALYPTENEYNNAVSLACNQAITMAGQYFLLKNYIETNINNLPKEVILLCTPFTLSNDVDIYAYQYFLKSFPIKEYKFLYSDYLYERIRSIPFYWTANLPFIQTSNYTPRVSIPQQQDIQNISNVSIEYLLLIDSLTTTYNIPFVMYPTPVREDKQEEIQAMQNDFIQTGEDNLNHIMLPYFDKIIFYPSDCFYDRVHLYNDFIPVDYLNIMNDSIE